MTSAYTAIPVLDKFLSDDLIHLPPTQTDFNVRVMSIREAFCFRDKFKEHQNLISAILQVISFIKLHLYQVFRVNFYLIKLNHCHYNSFPF